nr:retrovirus-related Pol polyprotein from transposon TNT 1-94 [Tanacetum cinerariifolium]
MDLCGPMRVESFNCKKYVLVIIDDYSRYTWTHFLRSKDKTPKVLIDFLKPVQRGLHAQEGIKHQTLTARTPEQNDVVERRNCTLVEAARIMLSATKFFWAEAIETTCFTQNRSLEEVYVNQTARFIDPHHPDKVYRLKKALYGLKQALRAWYDELSNFLISKGISKGYIDPTLFITKKGRLNGSFSTLRIPSTWDSTFSYLDHAGCLDACKSTFGGIQLLGSDKLVSWSSKKHDCILMSLAEAQYVSLFACCAQVLWLRTQLTYYGFHFDKISMYFDSKAAIAISCNPVHHSRTKHIDVRYYFIKEQVEKGIVELFFVGIEYQLADLFTKALPEDRFKYLVRRLGMRCLTPEELEARLFMGNRVANVPSAAQYLIDLTKASKASRNKYILQQRPKGLGDGSSVIPETPNDQSDSSVNSHSGSDDEEGFFQTDDEEFKDKSDDKKN